MACHPGEEGGREEKWKYFGKAVLYAYEPLSGFPGYNIVRFVAWGYIHKSAGGPSCVNDAHSAPTLQRSSH